jgi:hypothetical protein
VHLSFAAVLESLYSLETKFFGGNVIRKIYFGGKNRYILPEITELYRSFINAAPARIKQTLIDLFRENLMYFHWDEALAAYLQKEYGYTGDFAITDVTDFSIGGGVYRFSLELPEGPASGEIDVFLKRASNSDLRNEAFYVDCEKRFLGDNYPEDYLDRMPFYYHNTHGPDVLVSPVIKECSLNRKLYENLFSAHDIEADRSIIDVQQKILFKQGVDEQTRQFLRDEEQVVANIFEKSSDRLKAIKTISFSKT